MRKQLEFLVSGSETERYHTVRTIQRETVGHHSHGVAVLVHMLGGSENAVRAALFHDLAEHILGDIPAPAKKQYDIGPQINALETRLLQNIGFGVAISALDERILKLADIFQGMLFCIRECELGNRTMHAVYNRYHSYARTFVLVGRESEIFEEIERRFHECQR